MHNAGGGKAIIKGLDSHVSSSPFNKALKISLNSFTTVSSPRQIRLQNIANENSYQYTKHVEWDTSYLKNFHFFEIRQIERKSNSIKGNIEEFKMNWEIADVTFSEGAAFTAEVFNTTVMVLKLNNKIPVFSIEKEGLFEKIFDRVMAFSGYKDIDFEMYTDFSKKFLVMGNNEKEIKSFFTNDIINFLESKQIFHIESNGEALLIFDKFKLARTDETIKFIEFAKELAEVINLNEVT
jgi:hypothetical protein